MILETCTGRKAMTQIEDRLVFMLCSVEHAKELLPPRLRDSLILSGTFPYNEPLEENGFSFHPIGLGSLYRYCVRLCIALARAQKNSIVLCAGRNPRTTTNAALLAGAYLILCRDHSLEAVERAFHPISSHIATYDDNILLSDCWHSLAHARSVLSLPL